MAPRGSNSGAVSDIVELEAMRRHAFSWHPCQVSLCSGEMGLIVQYGDDYLEETISNKEGVLAHVRVRSTPLQGDDCTSLQQGDRVLATRSSNFKGPFYDAQVEEANRVRHSKRIHCRCTFTIKWLHQTLEEETLTVPASAIMKLSTKSINLHPTINTFFHKVDSSDPETPFPSKSDMMDLEGDVYMMLEKQIQEISKSADVSQTKISNNFVFGLNVDLKGKSNAKAVDASFIDPCFAIPLPNNLKAYTVADNKQVLETLVKDYPNSISSHPDRSAESRSPLNPLAARAALALVRAKLPQSAELSVHGDFKKEDIDSSEVDHYVDNISAKISGSLGGKSPKFDGIVRTLFPPPGSPKVELSHSSSRAQEYGMEKKSKKAEKQTTQPSQKRFTRSQVQHSRPSVEARRVTRSTGRAQKTEAQEVNAGEENKHTTFVHSQTPSQSFDAPQKEMVLPVDGETNICHTEKDNSLLAENRSAVKINSDLGSSAKDKDRHNYSRRLTRSAGRQDIEKDNVQPKPKTGKNKVSNSSELDVVKGNGLPEHNNLKLDKAVSPTATVVVLTVDGETNICNSDKGNNLSGENRLSDKVDYEKRGLNKNTDGHNCSRRLTRSAARVEMEKNYVQFKQNRKNEVSNSIELGLFEENVLPEHKSLEFGKTISPIAPKTSSETSKEIEKKNEDIVADNKATPSIAGSSGISTRSKRTISGDSNQEKRFSPRLRNLHQTGAA